MCSSGGKFNPFTLYSEQNSKQYSVTCHCVLSYTFKSKNFSIDQYTPSEANNPSVKKFPTFYGGKMFLTTFAIDPILSQINTLT